MEKKKVYVLYLGYYGELATEIAAASIAGVYSTREQAERARQKIIEEDINESRYVLDEEVKDDYLNRDIVILFWQEQENWDCYYEIGIEEMEVE